MRYTDYSHRHGRELFELLHPSLFGEVKAIMYNLPPYPHGKEKFSTVKASIETAFRQSDWEGEKRADFRTSKSDYIDLYKERVGIETEFSRFEMFFRDFFRFMLLYERNIIDVGVIITFDEMAYLRWEGEAPSYKSARASLGRLVDFLQGDYRTVVNVPLWCIGIE